MPQNRVETVLSDLKTLLHDRAVVVGERLPPERVLAAQLGCSRQTLRAALAILERSGDLWRHVGQGTFFGSRPLGHPVKDQILVQSASPLQMMQARLIIEPSVAAEAARTATASDVAVLARLVERGRTASTRPACEQADADFHRALAGVTGNPILLGLLDYLAGARRRATWQREWETTYRRLGMAEFNGHHSTQHARIVTAIAQHDPAQAAAEMQDHLETIMAAMATSGLPVARGGNSLK